MMRRKTYLNTTWCCCFYVTTMMLALLVREGESFGLSNQNERLQRQLQYCRRSSRSSSKTELRMVFDFFRDRAKEGVAQLDNLSKKASQGKLGEGLLDAATYTQQTNAAIVDGLAKSRNQLLYDLEGLYSGQGDVLLQLEDTLLRSDLGTTTTNDILQEVRSLRQDSTTFVSQQDLKSILRGKLLEALDTQQSSAITFADPSLTEDPLRKLTVLFVMGANGMGKTTTIGKLAHRLQTEGDQKVLLAACDTYRAAAVPQLQSWAERAQVDCYAADPETQNGPSAVLYGALDQALEQQYDTLIVDTSGRLSNNQALNAELLKMKRVIKKRLKATDDEDNVRIPHEILLVLDAAQGRMALDSAKTWHKEIGPLTGLVLTKLDGTAKGGSVVAISRELGVPVKLIGVGEGIEDLRDFNPESFVDGLLGIGSGKSATGSKGDKNEGKMLAGRLEQMRKERDAAAQKSAPTAATATTNNNNMDAIESDNDDNDGINLITNNNNNNLSNPSRKKNKKNKKKKKKGKR